MKKIISGLLFGCVIASVFADVPVVDYSSRGGVVSDAAQSFAIPPSESSNVVAPIKINLNADQRIGRLEQQINNINGQDFSHKLEELQQNLQKMNGIIEAQAHQIEQLNKQLKDFYQDLSQRLGLPRSSQPQTAASASYINAAPSIITNNTGNAAGAFNVNTDNAFLKEQQMYQTAIDLLPDKKHESENKLRDYLKQYPKGVYVANAHYWLGEINFLQKNFDAAEEEFKIVVDKYSKSKRIADATLKLALVHQNQGREAQAKQELQKVVKRYPGTSAAQLAKQQLAAP